MNEVNPQPENGYTRIANELLEAIISYPFTKAELKLILLIIRKTYGWNRKKVSMSYGILSNLTYLNKRYIKKVIYKLIKDKVLTKEKDNKKNILGLNKRYHQWRLNIHTQKDTTGVSCRTLPGVLEDTPKGVLADTSILLNTERNRDKERFKETNPHSKFSFFKPKTQTLRKYSKQPIHIRELISLIS
ncbi:MAG: replication protein [Candidatus Omnitrophica bacterium]|nr:replication protein [Candidatus Omnitrophota bacterium]